MSVAGEKLIAAIRKEAEENPDRISTNDCVYDANDCVYFEVVTEYGLGNDNYYNREDPPRLNGKGSCIVGCALIDSKIFVPIKGDNPPSWNEYQFLEILSSIGLYNSLEPDEKTWISNVQIYQDARYPWSLAVEEADRLGNHLVTHLEIMDYKQLPKLPILSTMG